MSEGANIESTRRGMGAEQGYMMRENQETEQQLKEMWG